jgi:low molecular weight phosphotyrosine protein phosphatase
MVVRGSALDDIDSGSQVQKLDFDEFDYIFAMDRQNLSDLKRLQAMKPGSKAKVMLFGEYSGSKRVEEIDDPYYGARDGFETAYEQATRFSKNFLKDVFPDVEA